MCSPDLFENPVNIRRIFHVSVSKYLQKIQSFYFKITIGEADNNNRKIRPFPLFPHIRYEHSRFSLFRGSIRNVRPASRHHKGQLRFSEVRVLTEWLTGHFLSDRGTEMVFRRSVRSGLFFLAERTGVGALVAFYRYRSGSVQIHN